LRGVGVEGGSSIAAQYLQSKCLNRSGGGTTFSPEVTAILTYIAVDAHKRRCNRFNIWVLNVSRKKKKKRKKKRATVTKETTKGGMYNRTLTDKDERLLGRRWTTRCDTTSTRNLCNRAFHHFSILRDRRH
jgi:hypothetical protein